MSGEITGTDHLAALEALRQVARRTAVGLLPAELDQAIVDAAGDDGDVAAELARMYVFGARVGGASATPERAAMWFKGWSGSSRRTPQEGNAAVVDGIRFGERLHRALGVTDAS